MCRLIYVEQIIILKKLFTYRVFTKLEVAFINLKKFLHSKAFLLKNNMFLVKIKNFHATFFFQYCKKYFLKTIRLSQKTYIFDCLYSLF